MNAKEDSSDDDEGGDDSCLKRNPDGSCQIYNNVQHFYNDFGELEFKWSSCNDPYDENHEDFEEVAKDSPAMIHILLVGELERHGAAPRTQILLLHIRRRGRFTCFRT